jgi:hypothetical protein
LSTVDCDNREFSILDNVYVVVEPRLDATTRTIDSRSFRYRYPDGPDDAEAFAVLPDGDVTIVSKGRSGTIAFFRLRGDAIARATMSGEGLSAEYAGDSGIRPDAGIHTTRCSFFAP